LRTGLPGAALALLIWVIGSVLLRLALSASSGSTTIYGPLAAPIAVLIWLYVISLAVLAGAAFNAAVDDVWPWLSGISKADRVAGTDAEPEADADADGDGDVREEKPAGPAVSSAGRRPGSTSQHAD
jgi:membrane protein